MQLRSKIILFFTFINFSAHAQNNVLFISCDKEYYDTSEVIRYTITQSSVTCNGSATTAYLELLNSTLQTVKQQIVRLMDVQTKYQLPLEGLDSGYYLLRAYTKEQAKYSSASIQYIAIGIGISQKDQNISNDLTVAVYPEGHRALVNFTNRFAIHIQSQNGTPVQQKLLIKNKAGQLIAVCHTDITGWGAVDVPVLEDEIITVQTTNGIVLHTINTVTDEAVHNSGFSLHVEAEGSQVNVELRKAEREQKRKVALDVFYKDVLLYDAAGLFRGDTGIVATTFSAKGLENKLLHLLLKDEEGNIVSERLMMVPAISTSADLSQIRQEIFCQSVLDRSLNPDNISLHTLNDNLIALKQVKQTASETEGFSLYFINKKAADQTLHYSITDASNTILQMGITVAGSTGLWEIPNCTFIETAYITFYMNGQRLNNHTEVFAPPLIRIDTAQVLQKIISLSINTQTSDERIVLNSYKDAVRFATKDKELLEEVLVTGKKSRMWELEEKYISSGIFKDMNSISINVEDDPAATNYRLKDFLIKEIPGLLIRWEKINGRYQEVFIYRNGYLDYYLDETLVEQKDLDIFMGNVAYIKFFRNPVNGGMGAQKGGQLLKGGSGFVGGLQGSIAIYTKKYSEGSTQNNSKGIEVMGYVN